MIEAFHKLEFFRFRRFEQFFIVGVVIDGIFWRVASSVPIWSRG
jgi:hypothetical protein